MLELSALFIVFLGIYLLFIKGLFWKIIIFIFAWAGMYNFLHERLFGQISILSVLGYNITLDILIPTLIIIFGMAATKIIIKN